MRPFRSACPPDTACLFPPRLTGMDAGATTQNTKEQAMLVLSRQRDETIMIGDNVEITVVDVRGDKVRLGIAAPPKVQVHRKEVYDAIKAENANASSAARANDLPDLATILPPGAAQRENKKVNKPQEAAA